MIKNLFFLLLLSSLATAYGEQLEEIVVTAQKREQSISDVPMAINVISKETILEQGYARLDDLSEVVPGLIVQDTLVENLLSLRGISTQGFNPSFEHSLSTFIDGVSMGRGSQSLIPFLDVERVEVLRGPQPLFFGQNAIAGALSVVNRGADKTAGYIHTELGSDGQYSAQFAYGLQLGSDVSGRIAVGTDGSDGWLQDVNRPNTWPKRMMDALRLSLLWTPSDAYSMDIRTMSSKNEQTGSNFEVINCAPSRSSQPGLCDLLANDAEIHWDDELNNRVSMGGRQPLPAGTTHINLFGFDLPVTEMSGNPYFDRQDRTLDSNLISIEQVYDHESFSATWLVGYSDYDQDYWIDIDYSPYAFRQAHVEEQFRQRSHELRISAKNDSSLHWMAGLYYQNNDITAQNITFAAFSPVSQGVYFVEQDSWHSVFANVSIDVGESWRLDLGARHSDVEKQGRIHASTLSIDGIGIAKPLQVIATPVNDQRLNNSEFDVMFSATWNAGERLDLYGRYASGFKAGAFNVGFQIAPEPDTFTVLPEQARTLELGSHIRLLDSRLALNASFFSTRYDDMQLSVFHQPSVNFIAQNVARAGTDGVEIDGRLLLEGNLQIGFSATWLVADYENYPGARCNNQEVSAGVCINENPDGRPAWIRDRDGEDLVYAPGFSANLVLSKSFGLTQNLDASITFNGHFSTGYETSTSYWDDARQGSYQKYDLRVAVMNQRGIEAAVFARNFTDKQTLAVRGTASVFNGENAAGKLLTRGASYGLQLRYRID